jgi:hypothetical protein
MRAIQETGRKESEDGIIESEGDIMGCYVMARWRWLGVRCREMEDEESLESCAP